MGKFVVYIVFLVFISISCRRNGANNEATAICNCYDQIHDESVRSENEVELQEKIEICNHMLSSKLASFGSNEEDKADFMKEFRACQEN